ncbi:hypothetical protein E2562_014399 [Oryza meyeriana var. granulata]|uniref:DUF1618 domain-containing protein n=1 Tax=Oryza meyeriana var. granulata TaxID=110450 RepID=A0A6G1CPQ7_9ORYZ|nr:hypothetical protein E2562_014399 [Oryza meyeriana var. granulata]
MYHFTTKTITLGGAKGTVGWVDLWRGILLCDLLDDDETPKKLREMPLPLPAKGNWRRYLHGNETVTTTIPSATPADDPDSYLEWVHRSRDPQPATRRLSSVHPGRWRISTWSMPIPVTSWDDWRPDCTADLHEFHLDNNPRQHCELLHKLMPGGGGGKDKEEAKAATSSLSLGCLRMCYPAISIDDDVVYLLCNAASSGARMGVMIGVDVKNKELQGVAKPDSKKNTLSSIRCYLATGISKHLNTTTDTRVGQVEEDADAAE